MTDPLAPPPVSALAAPHGGDGTVRTVAARRRSVLALGLSGGLASCVLPLPVLARPALARPALAQGAEADGTWPVTLRDVLGREVTIARRPRALVLAEGMQLLTLSLIHPDPVAPLAAIGGDLRRVDPRGFAAMEARFPALSRVPVITTAVGQSPAAEQVLALGADLVVMAAWQFASEDARRTVEVLGTAGVPVLAVDMFVSPLGRTVPSIRLLGRALGRVAQAEALAAFHEERVSRIRARVAGAGGPVPLTWVHAFPGRWDCCWTAGRAGTGEFLDLVGARNMGAEIVPGPGGGVVNLEQALAAAPEIYVGTGSSESATDESGLILGTGVGEDRARASLRRVLADRGLAAVPAVRAGRAHGLWNFLRASPINIAEIEVLARWTRPALFGDLAPRATLNEINRRFAAVPFEGTYWVGLDPAADAH